VLRLIGPPQLGLFSLTTRDVAYGSFENMRRANVRVRGKAEEVPSDALAGTAQLKGNKQEAVAGLRKSATSHHEHDT